MDMVRTSFDLSNDLTVYFLDYLTSYMSRLKSETNENNFGGCVVNTDNSV